MRVPRARSCECYCPGPEPGALLGIWASETRPFAVAPLSLQGTARALGFLPGCGPGEEALDWELGGCFGFNFFSDPGQKPWSLGLRFFLDYIF